jgi:hypothetical protein
MIINKDISIFNLINKVNKVKEWMKILIYKLLSKEIHKKANDSFEIKSI